MADGNAWYVLGLFAGVMVFQGLWGKLMELMTDDHHPLRPRTEDGGVAEGLPRAPASFDRHDLTAPIGSKWGGVQPMKLDDDTPPRVV